jgi:3-hydroxyisobutyrate/3-hydroxypropionate dehydrogenase
MPPGLKIMGYPMTKNVRTELGPEKTLLICDVSNNAPDRFKTETEGQGPVGVVSSGDEAAKAAVI